MIEEITVFATYTKEAGYYIREASITFPGTGQTVKGVIITGPGEPVGGTFFPEEDIFHTVKSK